LRKIEINKIKKNIIVFIKGDKGKIKFTKRTNIEKYIIPKTPE